MPRAKRGAPVVGRILKIAVLGPSGVGKTALVRRFVYGMFPRDTQPTINLDYVHKSVEVFRNNETRTLALQLWDTVGQERYADVMTSMLRGLDGALVVYDVNDAYSLERAEAWARRVREFGAPVIVLVGNKIDLRVPSLREVTADMARDTALRLAVGMPLEASASSGAGVASVFETISTRILDEFESAPLRCGERAAEAAVRARSPSFSEARAIACTPVEDVVEFDERCLTPVGKRRAAIEIVGTAPGQGQGQGALDTVDMLEVPRSWAPLRSDRLERQSSAFKLRGVDVPRLVLPGATRIDLDVHLASFIVPTPRHSSPRPDSPSSSTRPGCAC